MTSGDLRVTDAAQLRELVESSGISHVTIARAGLFTEADPRELAKMTGIARAAWTDAHLPALVFPYIGASSPDASIYSVKPAIPLVYKDGHTAKYVRTRNSGIEVYLPPSLRSTEALKACTTVIVTEGEKKALSAESAGFKCIGIAGVDMWIAKKGSRELHPTLEIVASAGAELFIAFDSDRETNIGGVRRAEKKLAKAWANAGGKVFILRIPSGPQNKKWGLDDFLAAHGSEGAAQLRGLMEFSRKRGPEVEAEKIEAPATARACTDLGNAERFKRDHKDRLRWSVQRGWFVWTGTHWKNDPMGKAAQRLAEETVRKLYTEAADATTHDERSALSEHAVKSESSRAIAAMLSLAQAHFIVDDAVWDRDPYALNCENGTVDLRSGEIRAHRREDMLTRITPVMYSPDAQAPAFFRYLEEVQPEPDVRAYLARLFGYAAIGAVYEHVLSVFWGSGQNGKSVLADVVVHVLGEHAMPGPSSLIVASSSETHPADIASLEGQRLVVVHETKRGVSFDASKVKVLTGGDRLIARRMRQDFFTFDPSHTLLMLSNYRPRADASDSALWRRVHLVRWPVTIPEERRDRTLAARIKEDEAPGVLAWLVRGAIEWGQRGLDAPTSVKEQTAEYRSSEDVIGTFLEEHCVQVKEARVQAGALYEAFTKWCDANGARAMRGNDFAEEIISLGYRRAISAGRRFYIGLGLRAGEAGEDKESVSGWGPGTRIKGRHTETDSLSSPASPHWSEAETSGPENKQIEIGDGFDGRDWSTEQ